MKKSVIGIDVSKEKLDFCLRNEEIFFKELIVENTLLKLHKFNMKLTKDQ